MGVKFISHIEKVAAHIDGVNRRNIRDATMVLYRAVRKKMTGPRTGETYPLPGGGGGEYQASAPGEPPAKRTGALDASIRFDVQAEKGRVGTDNEYALKLEEGDARIEPRPFLEPAVNETESAIRRIMGRS